ncbi:hypothetical protein [Dyella sedimenti]|uniref:hypothetical protein n=1 Tax=Dyella sedimenti TaxID=2919947 RepID=UPI001FAAE0F6|nr:hypothetical protein [Dyella sedimenti]
MNNDELIDTNYDKDTVLLTHPFQQTDPKIIKARDGLLSAGPYRNWGTLTFQYELSDKHAKQFASDHWRKTQRELLGRNWISKGIQPLTGLVIMEKAMIFARTTREFGSCHFHYLIHDHPALDRDNNRAAAQLETAFVAAARTLTHRNRRWQLVSKHGAVVDPVWDQAGICGYVAKEAASRNWKWHDRVRFLCQDGAI